MSAEPIVRRQSHPKKGKRRKKSRWGIGSPLRSCVSTRILETLRNPYKISERKVRGKLEVPCACRSHKKTEKKKVETTEDEGTRLFMQSTTKAYHTSQRGKQNFPVVRKEPWGFQLYGKRAAIGTKCAATGRLGRGGRSQKVLQREGFKGL